MQISIAYLLMQMPAPSEVFLTREVKGLIGVGVKVSVYCLRGPHPERERLIAAQGLADVSISCFSYAFSWGVWRDLGYWLSRNPTVLWHMVGLIVRTCWKRPRMLIQSLLIVPKSFSIARAIEREGIRIMHAAWGHYPAVTAYLIKRLMPSIQFTLACGAYDRLARHPLTGIAANYAACILTQSRATAALLKNDWPKPSTPICVIARGVDIQVTSSFRGVNGKPPGVILSVGRLIQVKGHQYIVKAFSAIKRAMPHTRLVILGEGKYRPNLEQLIVHLGIRDSVELPGHLNQSEVFYRISQSSAFVFASESKSDVLPNAIKEAMAIGIPVITTPTTGIEELVQDGITGCIVPFGDVEAIANQIIRLLSDQPFADRLSKEGVHHIETNFDIKHTTQARKSLYSTLMSKRRLIPDFSG